MKIRIINLTECIINFNKCGFPLRGKEGATVEIDTEDKKNEILGIQRAGLIDVELESPEVPEVPEVPEEKAEETTEKKVEEKAEETTEKKVEEKAEEREATPEEIAAVQERLAQSANDPNLTIVTHNGFILDPPNNTETAETPKAKNKGGRPKGSKNKKGVKAPTEQQRVITAEAKTQEMGGRVVMATVDGVKEGRMGRSVINDIPDSERTRASIEAMKKLEKEEEEEISLPDTLVDESKLPPNEQMGRKATIATPEGEMKVNLVGSVVPESKQSKNANPFIDRPLDESEQVGRKATVMTEEGGKKIAMVNSVVPEAQQSKEAKKSEKAKTVKPVDRTAPVGSEEEGDDYSEAFIKDL